MTPKMIDIDDLVNRLRQYRIATDPAFPINPLICQEAADAIEQLANDKVAAIKKWCVYEQEYILPCFQWAEESDIDLPGLVRAKPGKNCVQLLVEELTVQLRESKAPAE